MLNDITRANCCVGRPGPQATEDRLEAIEELRRVPLLDKERSTALGTTMVADPAC